jgi:alcohol/geraniol dehydrogenase (NADP+)
LIREELGSEEVEIKVTHCGLCHSDLSMLGNEFGITSYPFVPAHEVIGSFPALGEDAKGLKIGQKVGLGWSSHSCLSWRECLSDDHHLCSSRGRTIVGRHGFADHVRGIQGYVPDSVTLVKMEMCHRIFK